MIDLDELEKKTKFSGFPRDEGVKVILSLISELRALRMTGKVLAETIVRMEKEMGVSPGGMDCIRGITEKDPLAQKTLVEMFDGLL